MDVEVKQPDGYYLKAIVTDVLENSLDVAYERGSRKPEKVDFSKCRAVTTDSVQKRAFKSGDIVDAYVPVDKNNADGLHAYFKMKIREIRGDFAVVQSIDTNGQSSASEAISLEQCRHTALATQIGADSVKSCTIEVPDDLVDFFANDEDAIKKPLQEFLPKVLIKFDADAKQIVAKSFASSALKKVQILQENFLVHSRQKMQWLHRSEETKKMLAVVKQPDEYMEEFEVQSSMMGLAIGSQGANISSVRKLEGVKDILVDDSQRAQGFCKIKVYAENAEIAEQARNMLEFLQKHVKVPHDKVGQVIGKLGKSIQDIVDKSGVLRVQIGEENPEHGLVDFTFTGTRESISNAELMVEFLLKHIKELDEIREEEEECKRKLFQSRHSPFQYSANNGYSLNNQPRAAVNGNGGTGGANRFGGSRPPVVTQGGGGRFSASGNNNNGQHNRGGGGGMRYSHGGGGRPVYGGGGAGGGQRRSQQPFRDRRSSSKPEHQRQLSTDMNTEEGMDNNTHIHQDNNRSAPVNDSPSGEQLQEQQQEVEPNSVAPVSQQQNKGGGHKHPRAGGGGRRSQPQRNRRDKADDE